MSRNDVRPFRRDPHLSSLRGGTGGNAVPPACPLIGQDGNIFNLVGIAARTLREAGLRDQAKELTHRIFSGECHSYGEALCLIGEYVTITDINDHSHSKCRNSRTDHER